MRQTHDRPGPIPNSSQLVARRQTLVRASRQKVRGVRLATARGARDLQLVVTSDHHVKARETQVRGVEALRWVKVPNQTPMPCLDVAFASCRPSSFPFPRAIRPWPGRAYITWSPMRRVTMARPTFHGAL